MMSDIIVYECIKEFHIDQYIVLKGELFYMSRFTDYIGGKRVFLQDKTSIRLPSDFNEEQLIKFFLKKLE